MPKIPKRQFLIKVAGVDGYFATRTGGRKTVAITKVYDGGATEATPLAGPPTYDDIVVGRPFDTDRDGPAAARLDPVVGQWDTSVDITPTDANLVAIGVTRHYRGRLSGLNYPEQDAKSGDEATFELTLSIVGAA